MSGLPAETNETCADQRLEPVNRCTKQSSSQGSFAGQGFLERMQLMHKSPGRASLQRVDLFQEILIRLARTVRSCETRWTTCSTSFKCCSTHPDVG